MSFRSLVLQMHAFGKQPLRLQTDNDDLLEVKVPSRYFSRDFYWQLTIKNQTEPRQNKYHGPGSDQ